MDLQAELQRLQQEKAALQAALAQEVARADQVQAARDEEREKRKQAEAELDEERAKREAAEQAVLRLQRDLEKLKRQLIGPKSERVVDPNQLPLPVGPEEEPTGPDTASEEADDEEPTGQTEKKRRRRKGSDRRDVSKMDHLIVEEHIAEVVDRLCPCGCGAEADTVGHEVAWRLDYKPAQLIRIRTVREKVVFPDHVGPDKATLVTAQPPIAFALPKALCGNRLLAQIAIDKYADHLPLFRQEARFKREGIHLPRSTLCTWMMELSELLQPVWKHMSREVLAGDWLRADATGMPVIDKARSRGKAHKGHLWAWGNYETVLFSYTPDKSAPTVAALFPGFEGTVLIDGATDFNLLEASKGVVRAGCWAHARRYFYEALKEDKTLALKGLGIIRELFMAERVVMAAEVDQRQALREELSAPVLEGIQRWVREELPRQVPGSAPHAALQYVHNQWNRLRVFLSTPQIACHNNDTERDLRRPVKGRDNWQFAGSPRGAKAAAIYYALIGTCLLQGIDPRAYLVEVLGRLDEPPSRLTPHAIREAWQAANQPT